MGLRKRSSFTSSLEDSGKENSFQSKINLLIQEWWLAWAKDETTNLIKNIEIYIFKICSKIYNCFVALFITWSPLSDNYLYISGILTIVLLTYSWRVFCMQSDASIRNCQNKRQGSRCETSDYDVWRRENMC